MAENVSFESLMETSFFSSASARLAYLYQSIPAGAPIIRILTLQPGSCEAPLTAKLKFAPLYGISQYEALSYVWGNSEKPHKILIDGKTLPITATLHTALQTLRYRSSSRDLWIDALCMNQSDEIEKSYQLGFMGTIYSRAFCVLCYLGPDNEARDGAEALRILRKLQEAGPLPERKITAEWIAAEGLPGYHDERWKAVFYFLSLPWFKRRWTIQEFVKATEFRLICGDAEMYWRDVEYGIGRWEQCNFIGWARATSQSDWSPFWNANEGSFAYYVMTKIKKHSDAIGYRTNVLRDLIEIGHTEAEGPLPNALIHQIDLYRKGSTLSKRLCWTSLNITHVALKGVKVPDWSQNRLNLQALLEMCVNNEASDPRDYIFALLGMAADEQEISKQLKYTEPVEVTYTRCARYLMQTGSRPFEILLSAGTNLNNHLTSVHRMESLPSWVPDWSMITPTLAKPLLATWSRAKNIYNASSDASAEINFDDAAPDELRLKGSFIDTITGTVQTPHVDVNDMGKLLRLQELKDYINDLDALFARHPDSPMWRVLIANATFMASTATLISIPDEDYKETYYDTRAAMRVPVSGHERSEMEIYTFLQNMTSSMPQRNWGSDWFNTFMCYTVCETAARRVGLASVGAKKNDRVFVALGCNVPLVVRAVQGKFNFIGTGYVHGMMQGEAAKLEEWKNEEICLV